MSEADVSTIFITGLPLDALPREFENMMRFFVFGYEGVKMAGAKGGGKAHDSKAIFVKFDHAENAHVAIKALNNQPFDLQYPEKLMRVEMARSNMKTPTETVSRAGTVMQAYQPPPPSHAHPLYQAQPVYDHGPAVSYSGAGGPQKRQRIEEDPGSVDTVAIFGATDQGFTQHQLSAYFGELPGFICFKSNAKVGGGFVKFASPSLAEAAIQTAGLSGLAARMAKTSMSSTSGDQGADFGQAYQPPAYEPPPQGRSRYNAQEPTFHKGALPGGKGSTGGKGGKRSVGSEGASVDTLILQGVTDKGWTPATLTDVFQNVPGYVRFKENPRVNGGFVKFTDPQAAMDAIVVAQNAGIDAQIARSSMTG